MTECLDFVEIVLDADPTASTCEPLVVRAQRRRPAWLVRVSAFRTPPRVSYALAAVAVLGCLLAADGVANPVGKVVVGVAPAPAPAAAAVGQSTTYAYPLGSHCPVGSICQVEGRARQDMWGSYNQVFTDSAATSSNLTYDALSGDVYYQELTAVSISKPPVTITLAEQRISHESSLNFAPTMDFMPRHGTPPQNHRTALITARRGPWLISVILTGPWGRAMPIQDALHWAAIAPLPE